jgi:hypothetical protein
MGTVNGILIFSPSLPPRPVARVYPPGRIGLVLVWSWGLPGGR